MKSNTTVFFLLIYQ